MTSLIWEPDRPGGAEPHARFLAARPTDVRLFRWDPAAQTATLEAAAPLERETPLRCADWSPHAPFDVVALGLANGRTRLLRLDSLPLRAGGDADAPVAVELLPTHTRACLALQFARRGPPTLAVGYDKVRKDYGLMVWDAGGGAAQAPVAQLALSESVVALGHVDASVVLAGVGSSAALRLYDLRSGGDGLGATAATRAVFGAAVDPLAAHRVATFRDGGGDVHVWDLRRFSEPVLVFAAHPERLALEQLQWSPSRRGALAGRFRDAQLGVAVWDVAAPGAASGDLPVVWRRRCVGLNVEALSWVPARIPAPPLQLLTCDGSGRVSAADVLEAPAAAVAPVGSSVVAAFGRLADSPPTVIRGLEASGGVSEVPAGDGPSRLASDRLEVGHAMVERAKAGYGLNAALNVNLKVHDAAARAWESIAHVHTLAKSAQGAWAAEYAESGVVGLVGALGPDGHLSDSARDRAWTLLGLPAPEMAEKLVDSVKSGDAAHAAVAAMAVLGSVDRACEILQGSGSERLLLVAAALSSGITPETEKGPWQTLCAQLLENTAGCSRHERFLLGLVAESLDWAAAVQREPSALTVRERIALALRHLSDAALVQFVQVVARTAAANGNLDALPLVGLSAAAVDIVSVHVDRTGDVQTAALLLSLAANRTFSDARVDGWVAAYRAVLNQSRLFAHRSAFDIARHRCVVRGFLQLEFTAPNGSFQIAQLIPRDNAGGKPAVPPALAAPAAAALALRGSLASPAAVSLDSPASFRAGTPSSTDPPQLSLVTRLPRLDSAPSPGTPASGRTALARPTTNLPVIASDEWREYRPIVRCQYCGSSVALCDAPGVGTAEMGLRYGGAPPGKLDGPARTTACPHCRQPLPLCCICSLGWGTRALPDAAERRFFVWCSACLHGGHASHLNEWFSQHVTCPVAGCGCACSRQGATSPAVAGR